MKRTFLSQIILLLIMVTTLSSMFAQKKDCPNNFEVIFGKYGFLIDKEQMKFSVIMADGNVMDNCIYAERLVSNPAEIESQGKQKIKLCFKEEGTYKTLELPVDKIKSFVFYGIGGLGQPIIKNVYPAREYIPNPSILQKNISQLPFFEGLFNIGYGGPDKSTRYVGSKKIGFNNFYYSFDVTFFPIASFLQYFSLGIGSGFIIENGRLRIPLKGELRFGLYSSSTSERFGKIDYSITDPFRFKGEQPKANFRFENSIELNNYSHYDSVAIYPKFSISKRWFDPFIFVEGGVLFNTKFEGSDLESPQILNKSLSTQFFIGGGLGTKLYDFIVVKLGYSFYKFNIVGDCVECNSAKVINVNEVNSIFLKLGFNLKIKI